MPCVHALIIRKSTQFAREELLQILLHSSRAGEHADCFFLLICIRSENTRLLQLLFSWCRVVHSAYNNWMTHQSRYGDWHRGSRDQGNVCENVMAWTIVRMVCEYNDGEMSLLYHDCDDIHFHNDQCINAFNLGYSHTCCWVISYWSINPVMFVMNLPYLVLVYETCVSLVYIFIPICIVIVAAFVLS